MLVVLFAFSCANTNQNKTIVDDAKILKTRKLDSIANSFLESKQVLGFSIAILEKEDTLYSKSFGHLDSDRKISIKPKTAFPIASVTKPHTSVLALKLQEQNLINLEDFFVDYYPELIFSDEMKKIKLVHLLNHTSGIPDYTQYADSLFMATNKSPTISNYLSAFKEKPLHFNPGSQFSYSNTGFVFITKLMEKVTGKEYGKLIQEYLAIPLKNKTLDLQVNNISKSIATEVFEPSDPIFKKSFINDLTYIGGDGGLSISAVELVHFPKRIEDETLINNESFRQLTSNTLLESGITANYGLGLRKGEFQGHEVWGHSGSVSSTVCVLGYFPELDISIAVMVNTDRTSANAMELFGFIALVVLEENVPDFNKITVQNENFNLFLGDYYRPTDSEEKHMQIAMYDEDSFLYRKMSDGVSKGEKLYYLGENTFAPESAPMDRLIFELDKNGEVICFKDYYNGLFINIRNKK